MHFIVKLFPEITLKSPPVRNRMTRQLVDNLRLLIKRQFGAGKVIPGWDKLEVVFPVSEVNNLKQANHLLACTPGIANFALVRCFPLVDMHDIFVRTQEIWQQSLRGKRFCVRVKRNGNHDFTSTDVERYVGGGLNQHNATAGVDLKNPEITIRIEVREHQVFILEEKHQGLGGFPIGTQEGVLSLVSGGFDSTVASFQSIRRGLKTHYCFFNLGGKAHELGVKEIAFYLWNRYGSTHRVKFVTVPFAEVVNEILQKVDPSCMGVVLKRQMIEAANKIATHAGLAALVTGEAIGQVSSQTLTNLQIIDAAAEHLVLRPLALMDKGNIIDIARAIGAEHFAANIPEYCGVISVKPSAHLQASKVFAQERLMDESVLTKALAAATVQDIDKVMQDVTAGSIAVERVSVPTPYDTIIDIRHPDEQENKPKYFGETPSLIIPFYQLSQKFKDLDASRRYLLFCERGVMSELHAQTLAETKVLNIGVYRPDLITSENS
ncbi:MAG TPA: tRNA uracil 4-sulfurtransferase ThiI [Cellvibrionaceae bacterium]